jgi:4-hydroxythreonine-4-phosphate dehydrogenase
MAHPLEEAVHPEPFGKLGAGSVPARRPGVAGRIAISLGDPSGVGPEVTAKALAALRGALSPVVYGDAAVLARTLGPLGLPLIEPGAPVPAGGALVAVTRLPARAVRPGKPAPEGGAAPPAYLEAAFAAVRDGEAAALVTAPVSKAQVARALPGFVGHTEWLEARCGARRSVMMLAGEKLKIALVTNHVAFARLRRVITAERIVETLRVTHRALHDDLGLRRPRLALAALNPHAGEEGAFGDEEDRLLRPALARAAALGAPAAGPFPADSVFFRAALGEFDAVVALYHDQGLIPVKLLDAVGGDPAVNVTLGLPVVRTSPDHGVAYDIAGKDRASPASMIAALRLASRIAAVRAGASKRARRPR